MKLKSFALILILTQVFDFWVGHNVYSYWTFAFATYWCLRQNQKLRDKLHDTQQELNQAKVNASALWRSLKALRFCYSMPIGVLITLVICAKCMDE